MCENLELVLFLDITNLELQFVIHHWFQGTCGWNHRLWSDCTSIRFETWSSWRSGHLFQQDWLWTGVRGSWRQPLKLLVIKSFWSVLHLVICQNFKIIVQFQQQYCPLSRSTSTSECRMSGLRRITLTPKSDLDLPSGHSQNVDLNLKERKTLISSK